MTKERPITKYLILIFGVFAVSFIGFTDIWGIYQPYAMEAAGWSQSQASLCFYLCFIFFVPGSIIGGRIQDHYGPRIANAIGGSLMIVSVLLSVAAFRPSPVMMYVTYGGMQGIGQGMIYSAIVATAQKWFPGKTGFASGAIVTANGIFGFVMSPVSKLMLESKGIERTFLMIAALVAISTVCSLIVIRNPDVQEEKAEKNQIYTGKQYTSKEMMETKKFYYLLAIMMFGMLPYLILSPITHVVQTDRGIAQPIAIAAIMAGSICSAATRLILPSTADKLGRIICMKGVMIVSAVTMVLLAAGPGRTTPVCVVLTFICYGGVMGSFPSLASSIFGLKHSGENYGYIMTGMAAATFAAPVIVDMILKRGYAMESVFAVGAMSAAAAFGFLYLLGRDVKETVADKETIGEH